jgi:UDP-glucose 4-epimerase
MLDTKLSGTINIGNNNPVSIKQLISIVEKKLNTTITTHTVNPREGDMVQTHADISTAEKVLGWSPMETIESIVEDEIKWQKTKLKKLL